MPNFLSSKNLDFRPVEGGDYDLFYEWLNDPVLNFYSLGAHRPETLDELEDRFDEYLEDRGNVLFSIFESGGEDPIGFAGFFALDSVARKAKAQIMFADKDFWARGLAAEALEMLNFVAFNKLNLNRVSAHAASAEQSRLSALEKAGFEKEGVQKEGAYLNGEYQDITDLAILRSAYEKNWSTKHKKEFTK